MQSTHLALLLLITLAPSLSQKLTSNALTSLLQDILSPTNTEQVIQVLSAAANNNRGVANAPRIVNRRFAIADNVPRSVIRTEGPNRMAQLVLEPQDTCLKKNVLVQNSNNVVAQNGNRMVLPKNVVLHRRNEAVLPKNVIIQNGREVAGRNVMVRKNETPKRVIVQDNEYAVVPQMRTPEVVQQKVFVNPQFPSEVQQKIMISQPQMTEYVALPQKQFFMPNDNPFLPAASPVSALAAASSCSLPPVMPQSRGQFLRKIPIPPPTL